MMSCFEVDIDSGEMVELARLPVHAADNLAIDSDDRIFIAFNDNGMIQEFLPNGTLRVVSQPGLTVPSGLAVLPRAAGGESLYVAALVSLIEFDSMTGERLFTLVNFPGASELDNPMTVATDGRNILLTSSFTNTVQIWDPQSREFIATLDDFDMPNNAIFFNGDIIVSEWEAERVVLASVANDSQRTVLVEGLGSFAGLVATEDDVWGATWRDGTLYQLVEDGVPLTEPRTIATGLQRPEGMAVWEDGRLLVVETGTGKLLLIDPETCEQVVVSDGLALGREGIAGLVPVYAFSDVAVGPSGTIYVQSDIENEIYRVNIDNCY